eukprot:7611967-Alexandrium_andersonii.AAC.1
MFGVNRHLNKLNIHLHRSLVSACFASLLARGAEDVKAPSSQATTVSSSLAMRHADKAGRHRPGSRPRVAQPCARAIQ